MSGTAILSEPLQPGEGPGGEIKRLHQSPGSVDQGDGCLGTSSTREQYSTGSFHTNLAFCSKRILFQEGSYNRSGTNFEEFR
jgi:hypothetical protein